MALEVLTLLSKSQRVSRTCDADTLVGEAGLWVELQSDGSVANITHDQLPAISKMLFNGNSTNTYESNDVSLGRITTLETIGARCKVDTAFLYGVIALGHDLYVSYTVAGEEGKLQSAQTAGAGTYNIVAKAQQVDASGSVTFEIVSPISLTIGS